MNKKYKAHSFAKGALIITLGMLAVKFFGALFKIPLMSLLGGEGSGYFTGAYNLYNPIYALSTAGLPIALSKIVSENVALKKFKNVKMIRKVSIPIFLMTGSIGFVLIILSSFLYAKLSKAPDSIYSIFMLAPALLFSCIMSSYRGYYEGLRNMTPTAVSEVIESFGKIIFGLSLSYFTMWIGTNELRNKGTVFGVRYQSEFDANGKILAYSSAAAILGVAISAFVAFLYIHVRYKLKGDNITKEQIRSSPPPDRPIRILKSILKIAIPVGLGAIIMNLAGVIDSVLIQRRLADIAFSSMDKLINIYGDLIPVESIARNNVHIFLSGCFGFTSTIIMFLPTISQGLAISALPTVTSSWAIKDKKTMKKNIEKILKLTSILSVPMGLGISSFAYPIMDLIYNTMHPGQQNAEIYIGSQIMIISGIGAIFTALSTPVCSMLQAIGRADLPLKILTIGMIIKIVLNYFLVGIPEINIQGAGIGTLACYVFVFMFAIIALCRNTKIHLNFISILVKPCIASTVCSLCVKILHKILCEFISYKLSTILSIFVSAIVYFIVVFALKTVTEEEIESNGKIKKIFFILKKLKIVNMSNKNKIS